MKSESADVAAKLRALGCDPIEGLVEIAVNPETPPNLRRKAFLALKDLVLPKERAISSLRRLLFSPRADELFDKRRPGNIPA